MAAITCILVQVVLSVCFWSGLALVNKEYCIIGAGPSGLQLAYFMETTGRNYIVIERSEQPGSFYEKFPRHGILISINKRWTDSENSEYCLRHDWNSLISHDPSLLFKHYSMEMFPKKECMLKYLKDYQSKLNIKVDFNTNVIDIKKISNEFAVYTNKREYKCQVVVIATGLSKPRQLKVQNQHLMQGYENMSINKMDYEGKKVLIIGKGNSAFETAMHLYGNTRVIHMASRNPVRLSWSTHYVGDVRAVNNELLDSYQLKSLDGLFETEDADWKLRLQPDGKISIVDAEDTNKKIKNDSKQVNDTNENPTGFDKFNYDVVIRACGFTWDDSVSKTLNVSSVLTGKYPMIQHQYESSEITNLFFAGTNTHSLDYRQAAGGFIHGFRYTTRALHRYLEFRRHSVAWPSKERPMSELVDALVKRINEGSGTYQMFSVLGDVVIVNKKNNTFKLLEEVPIKNLHILPSVTGHEVTGDVFVFVFEYGKTFSGPRKDVFDENRAGCASSAAHKCNFLHPVIYHFQKLPTESQMMDKSLEKGKHPLPEPTSLLHLVEDFFTDFQSTDEHIIPLVAFLEKQLNQPLYPLSTERCLQQIMSYSGDIQYCSQEAMRNSWSFSDFKKYAYQKAQD